MYRVCFIIIIAICCGPQKIHAQYCDSITPSFTANLSANPNAFWVSPDTARDGHCCGATNPDVCVEFEITLHPLAEGIIFDIFSGAVPPGALFYQIDCGPPIQVGEPVCLNGPGPHHLTFCKPGNNTNQFSIQSVSEPEFGPDAALSDGCNKFLYVNGFDINTITWTSVAPDNPADYNYLLNCTQQCDTVWVNWANSAPPWVDYLVCGKPLGGCDTNTYCDTIRVYFTSTLAVSIAPTNPTICFGQSGTTISAAPSGGSGPYTYNWSNGMTTPSNFVGPGQHVVQITDTTGCTIASDSVVVGQFTMPIDVNGGNDQNLCMDQLPANLNANFQAAQGIQWSSSGGGIFGSNTNSNTSYTPSNYDLQIGYANIFIETTGNGTCPAEHDTLTLYFNDFSANVYLQVNNVSCNGAADGSAFTTVNGVNGPYTYIWNNDPNQSGTSLQSLSPGSYSLQIINALGCDTVLNFSVTEPNALVFNSILTSNASCFGYADGSVAWQIGGGAGNYQYEMNNTSVQNNVQTGLVAGNYLLQITDANGCQIDSMVQLTQPQEIQTSLVYPDSVCPQQNFMIDLSVNGGTGPYSYQWQNGQITQDISVSTANSQNYSVLVTDNNGCQAYDSSFVYVFTLDQASLNLNGTASLCAGDTVHLSASYSGYVHPPFNYSWNHCPTCIGTGPYIDMPTSDQTYIVTITDGCGQQIHDTLVTEHHPLPQLNLPDTLAAGCVNLNLDYVVNANDSLSHIIWELSNGHVFLGDHVQGTIYDPGTYNITVTATSIHGCTNTFNNSTIYAWDNPSASFYADNSVVDLYDPTIDFYNISSGAVNSLWDFGDGQVASSWDASHTYQNQGSYEVILAVSNEYGCSDTAIRTITVNPVVNVFIPNAFTPDGDGINDVFTVEGENLVDQNYTLLIFDRWGENIFTSGSLSQGWDGQFRGETVKTDVYIYKVQVYDIFGYKHDFTGHVTLLK